MKVEIMDTTLRDGEQTAGLAFVETEKLSIARILLEELNVDRIEVASAKVSEGEFKSVKKITEWAARHNYLDKIEVLGFVDGKDSIDWIDNAGGRVLNLLCKGSMKHLTGQLRKTPEQHVADIKNSINYAHSLGISVNVYLEDWSNGMINSMDYVMFLTESLKNAGVMRIMLPDTLGILNHEQTYTFCKMMIDKFPDVHFDFHAHNDYDLAAANVYSAIKAGIKGVHTTVNGLGERAGNVSISSVIAILTDHLNVETNMDETKINMVSKMVESFTGIRISANKPVIGDNVFTQTCGVHADGDSKDKLYFNALMPERFGRVRKYALGKTAGKANIQKNLEEIGIELDAESLKKVTKRVNELGDQKEEVTREDLQYIISDVLNSGTIQENIQILNYSLSNAKGLKPVATVSMQIYGTVYEETSVGDGQYDAFMRAIRKIYDSLNKKLPKLIDYAVTIPPGGKTDALVGTVILWEDETGHQFRTRGLEPDQTIAAINATSKMLNLIELNK